MYDREIMEESDATDDDGARYISHVVDGALWLIGSNWEEWGEDYWTAATSAYVQK